MPIRTPRGRAAAYRGVWQWPLRSPARLLVTMAVVVAVAVGVSFALGSDDATSSGLQRLPRPGAMASGRPRVTPRSASVTPAPALELAPTTLPLEQAPQPALVVAARWSRAWVRPPDGTSAQQWLEGLRPTTTDEYLGELVGIDPSEIPATRVTGSPRAVRVAPMSVDVEVPTDALTLLVTLAVTDTGWRVTGYDRM